MSVRINESLRYANLISARNQDDKDATSFAYDDTNTSSPRKVIVKTSASSYKTIANYTYNTWNDYKLVINMQDNTYTVYMEGQPLVEDYSFRTTGSTSLIGQIFGIDKRSNGQLDLDNFKVRVE